MASLDFSKHNEEPFLSLNCEVVEDYAEFSKQDIFDVFDKIVHFKDLAQADFDKAMENSSGDKWAAQVDFYANSDHYIYDLLCANGTRAGIANKLNKFLPNGMSQMKSHKGSGTFMDFGAGCGVLCQIMAQWGKKKVTYIDIESPATKFARWRFDKYNLTDKVEMVIIPQEDFTLDCQYSIIFTDAVWEHLPHDKQEAYAEKLANAVELNGLLVFIVDIDGARDDRAPFHRAMHYTIDLDKIFSIFTRCGLSDKFIASYKGFASIWEKKE